MDPNINRLMGDAGTRFVECPHCDGGHIYWDEGDIDRATGAVMERRRRCDECGGSGRVEIDAVPLTLDEALDLDAEILAAQMQGGKP